MADHGDLLPAGLVGGTCFALGITGVFDEFATELLVAFGGGIVVLIIWALLELWTSRQGQDGSPVAAPATPDDTPLRVRVKEWGDAAEIWSKVILRVTGAALLCAGGLGLIGTSLHKIGEKLLGS